MKKYEYVFLGICFLLILIGIIGDAYNTFLPSSTATSTKVVSESTNDDYTVEQLGKLQNDYVYRITLDDTTSFLAIVGTDNSSIIKIK